MTKRLQSIMERDLNSRYKSKNILYTYSLNLNDNMIKYELFIDFIIKLKLIKFHLSILLCFTALSFIWDIYLFYKRNFDK